MLETAQIRFTFVYGLGFWSWLIARFGFSGKGWSHVAPTLPDGCYIDARDNTVTEPKSGWNGTATERFPPRIPAGVQLRPPHYQRWKRWEVLALTVTKDQAVEWEKYLNTLIGESYDSDAILGYVLDRPLHRSHSFICSAQCISSCIHIEVFHQGEIIDSEVTPNAFYLILEASGAKTVATST
jgi:hypothetical protein